MKERKKIRNGITLYSKTDSKFYPQDRALRSESDQTGGHRLIRNPLKNRLHPFLLAGAQLAAVWFLMFSWWHCLTGVFPIEADTPRLYLLCFLFTAALTALWNAPLRRLWKFFLPLLFFCLAGVWIWRHQDGAVNVINLTANAYLSVRRPNANPYTIRPVPDPEMAFMFALFLLPLLFIWSLVLHLRAGKLTAYVLLLAPAGWILAETLVPSETSCWLLILSGGVYAAICGCRDGRAALLKGTASACVLALLISLSAFASRPLEACKEPSDGFYARTRETIETGWIQPLQDSYTQAKAEREEKKRLAREVPPEQEQPQNPEQPDADSSGAKSDPPQPQEQPAVPNPTPETDIQPEFSAESSGDTPDGDTSQPSAENGLENAEALRIGTSKGTVTVSTAKFPDLNALSHFQPDAGTRLTLTLDSRPEGTVYHPSAYGVSYMDSHWYDLTSENGIPPESYLEYPDSLERLDTLCQEHAPETLAEASDFIQKEFENHTVYDFRPGPTPSGQDFAEYFLFDNQKGFCVHFATTAALMYRMCGYPSRYVQGYAVPASAFRRQEDGSYTAKVTGDMGHAWCQVLEDGKWITKEHTLPYHGARPEPGIPAASSGRHAWTRNAAGWGLFFLKSCAVCILCLGAAILLLLTQAALRRQRRYRKFRSVRRGAGIRRIYRALYDTAVFQGMEPTDLLSLQGFETLRDYFPEIPSESMEWLYQTVLETMFYNKNATKEDTKKAWKIYRQFSHMVKQNMTPSRRFIYQYMKVY